METFKKSPNECYDILAENFWTGSLNDNPDAEQAFLLAAHYKRKAELAIEGLTMQNALLTALAGSFHQADEATVELRQSLEKQAALVQEYIDALKSDFWSKNQCQATN